MNRLTNLIEQQRNSHNGAVIDVAVKYAAQVKTDAFLAKLSYAGDCLEISCQFAEKVVESSFRPAGAFMRLGRRGKKLFGRAWRFESPKRCRAPRRSPQDAHGLLPNAQSRPEHPSAFAVRWPSFRAGAV